MPPLLYTHTLCVCVRAERKECVVIVVVGVVVVVVRPFRFWAQQNERWKRTKLLETEDDGTWMENVPTGRRG